MNLIAKLLMNSLYGKFGKHQDCDTVHVINKQNLTKDKIVLEKNNIK